MEYYRKGSSCGWTCPNCGDGIVTTYKDPWSDDFITYTISLGAVSNPSSDLIRTISKISGLNSVSSKKLLMCGGEMKKDRATNIVKILSVLSEQNINYSVSPIFPYELPKKNKQ